MGQPRAGAPKNRAAAGGQPSLNNLTLTKVKAVTPGMTTKDQPSPDLSAVRGSTWKGYQKATAQRPFVCLLNFADRCHKGHVNNCLGILSILEPGHQLSTQAQPPAKPQDYPVSAPPPCKDFKLVTL